MKKLLFIAGFLFISLGANAQKQGDIALDLYGGYTFQDRIYANSSNYVEVRDAFQYGAGLEFFLRPTKSLEMKYLRMDTRTPIYSQTIAVPLHITQANVSHDRSAINYVLLAGNNYFQTANPSVVPFAGLGVGIGWASGDQSTNPHFAWDFKAGVKIKASDAVAVKLQAYFQSIWGTYGSQTYFYPGWGVVTYPSNASLYQFGLGAAFAFDFKH